MSATPPELAQICVQVQPDRAPGLDVSRLIAAGEMSARAIKGCRGFDASQGEDDGAYANLIFATENPADSWPELRSALLESVDFGAALKQSCICLCTGGDGWNDCLLLYHFDPDQPLDDLPG